MTRLIIFLVLLCTTSAQESITVGIKSAPPFVILSQEKPSGFSIDLIEKIITDINKDAKIVYHIDEGISPHLQSIEEKRVDLGIAATTVTFEREARMEFSQPFYYSGLGILVREEESAKWKLIFSQETLLLFVALAIYVIVIANLIWFFERKQKTFSRIWHSGVAQGAWWTIVTMSTVGYGDFSPQTRMGRLLAIFVIFSGICLFGLLIASFSSALTLDRMGNNIKNMHDTMGFPVAVVSGTTGEKYMQKIHPNLVSVGSLSAALKALEEQRAKAVVHDIPILRYYMKNNTQPKLKLVEGIFFPSAYAIAFPIKSPLRKRVNIRLLKIMESELYNKLITKWFGRRE
ncbi:transporter substrate-binding domain-containing protein [Candidatus Uabimicrobium amorphum]|uniref:Amino acid ABC transporter substrate-binding protein n=1 Tax=Uabimicrobium amorphum TaxID=2596890 RepID=A0A5S9F2U3_UABAM|nr:transporter substrate-binding domain-containing protein [Candidatus Uabimicrobium amorphum]BBM84037.1 amino acid ABC transporter substrate-binding protein [Candidatus Uabimicrobium amorphum]